MTDTDQPTNRHSDTEPCKEYRFNRTPGGLEQISKATLKHGGRKAQLLFRRGQSLEEPFSELWQEIIADKPALVDALGNGGLIADAARRYVDSEVVRRLWVNLIPTAVKPDDLAYFSAQARSWFKVSTDCWLIVEDRLDAQKIVDIANILTD